MVQINRLNPGDCIKDAEYKLVYENNGNLVIYDNNCKILWSSGTKGKKAGRAVMEKNGVFVLYDAINGGNRIWQSHTSPENDGEIYTKFDLKFQAGRLFITTHIFMLQSYSGPSIATVTWEVGRKNGATDENSSDGERENTGHTVTVTPQNNTSLSSTNRPNRETKNKIRCIIS